MLGDGLRACRDHPITFYPRPLVTAFARLKVRETGGPRRKIEVGTAPRVGVIRAPVCPAPGAFVFPASFCGGLPVGQGPPGPGPS